MNDQDTQPQVPAALTPTDRLNQIIQDIQAGKLALLNVQDPSGRFAPGGKPKTVQTIILHLEVK